MRLLTGTMVFFALTLAASAAQGRFASFVPVNAKAYRLHAPDGVERIFVRDPEQPEVLYGDGDWVAELDGRRALVMKDVESAEDREGYLCQGGYIVKQLRGTMERNLSLPSGGDEASLAALWPAEDSRLVAFEAPDIWTGGGRLRLWFHNPNSAGALLAGLSLAVLVLLAFKSLFLKILGSLLSLAGFAALLATGSRGSLVGFLAGIFAVVCVRFGSLFRLKRILCIVGVLAVAVGCLFATGQVDRMTKELLDQGPRETSRLTIWREVPRMMADAPCGWGWNQSARAYIDWYQPESGCLLKNMISAHLTFLVETGWPLRFAYVALWLFLVGLAFFAARRGFSPVPLAVIVAFGVAAAFNPVFSEWELWVVPLLAFAALLAYGVRRVSLKTCFAVLLVCAVVSSLFCVGIGVWGRKTAKGCSILKSGGAVCLNGDAPQTWLVDDDYTLHGGYWWLMGSAVRNAFENGSRTNSLGYARSLADVPEKSDTLVLVGEQCANWLRVENRPDAAKIVMLSPPFLPGSIPAELREGREVSVVMGELAYRLAGGEPTPPKDVRLIPGAELFIPGWLRYLP